MQGERIEPGWHPSKHITEVVNPTIDGVRAVMFDDDACNRIVPSDLRVLIGEIDRLRREQADYFNVLKAALYLEPNGIDLVNRLITYAISQREADRTPSPTEGGGNG